MWPIPSDLQICVDRRESEASIVVDHLIRFMGFLYKERIVLEGNGNQSWHIERGAQSL